mmetsp:Transcript_146754/g.365982  ORF Transcript_146754/g.365982 Transcript_146754/m.365982 type:complete len:88 (+) Transcript_146754:307-570(+)
MSAGSSLGGFNETGAKSCSAGFLLGGPGSLTSAGSFPGNALALGPPDGTATAEAELPSTCEASGFVWLCLAKTRCRLESGGLVLADT